jgi:hypothetical protein
VAQSISGLLQDWDNYYQTDSFAKDEVPDGYHPRIFQYGDGECNVINGSIFLFSAALGLASSTGNLAGRLLRTYILEPLFDWLDKVPFVDDSPWGNLYRYSHVDLGGAAKLSKPIKKLDDLGDRCVVQQPLFAVHSEADEVRGLVERSRKIAAPAPPRAELFKIGQYFNVPHTSIVLNDPVFSQNNSLLKIPNPFFETMIEKIHEFLEQYHLTKRT